MPVRLIAHEEPLPGYRLIERLGRGGFGEVWKCEVPGGLLKAMKFVFGDLEACDEDSRPAEQELKALERVKLIRHPYILSLELFRIIEGQLIIVMELADRNLWDRFRECRSQGLPGIPRDELLRYMEEAAEALDLMNNHYQIQHLDIKPQNLFVVFNHVKVGDFGLAKLLEGVRATVTGGVTPVYAAPETFDGWVSRFSDQYSLAIVFQELLTGTRPFNGANTRQLLMQHLNGKPDLNPLPPADRPVVARALEKKPDDRWPTCTEMIRALKLAGTTAAELDVPYLNASAGTPSSNGPSDSIAATRPAGYRPGVPRPAPGTPSKEQTPKPQGGAGLTGIPLAKPPANGLVSPSTPMPSLVTVGAGSNSHLGAKLVTPQATAANSPALTLQRPAVFQTGRMNSLGIAPPEKTGDGVVFPALVVAIGHLGRLVLDRFKQVLHDRYGNAQQVPNIRCLYVDTDPEALSSDSYSLDNPAALNPREIVPARLNRPAHYLQQSSMPPLDQWLPQGLLYKLPRAPGPAAGVRAFGRLALFDNYRTVAQRIRQEVETFLTDEPLATAEKTTGFGLRSNRPRVYVIAGLGGGTGSGMFLDLTYIIRHELKSVGYLRPDVAGLFLVPPADKTASRNTALGNTFAALTELYHFQSKRGRYQTAFEKSEAPILDLDAPFARTSILELPAKQSSRAQSKIAGIAARALFNEMLTPAGRIIDEVRDVYRNSQPSPEPFCQSFGLFRLTWPRPEMLVAATRRFAQRMIQRWTTKDAAHLHEPIAAWLAQQWNERQLGFEQVVEGFQKAVQHALREDPDRVFDAFIDPLRTRTPSGGKLDAAAICTVLDQLIKVVGKPVSGDEVASGSLYPVLSTHYNAVVKEAEVQVATMAVSFIEQPSYRLAGAEEAVRQIAEKLKQQTETLTSLHHDLDKDVKVCYSRLLQVIGGMNGGGGLGWKSGTTEALDLLRNYPRKRLQLQILDMVLSCYRKLLGNTPEYLREMNFCRTTLNEMSNLLGKPSAVSSETIGPGKMILPDGCANLEMAADQFLGGLSPEDVLAFDHQVQKETAKKFKGLAAVCLKPVEKGPHFRELLLTKSRAFLDEQLEAADPAGIFFRYRGDGQENHPLLGESFDKATPELTLLTGKAPDEFMLLAVPPGETGDHFREMVREAMPGVDFTPAPLPDDICFYREYPRMKLPEVPQLGEFAREAYQLMTDVPPHCRMDITWQTAGK